MQVRLVLDDGQRVLPPYVNRVDYDYESPEKGALQSWTSGAVQTPRGSWERMEMRLDGYPAGARRALVILQVWRARGLNDKLRWRYVRRLGSDKVAHPLRRCTDAGLLALRSCFCCSCPAPATLRVAH